MINDMILYKMTIVYLTVMPCCSGLLDAESLAAWTESPPTLVMLDDAEAPILCVM